jgi:hypothetical protein
MNIAFGLVLDQFLTVVGDLCLVHILFKPYVASYVLLHTAIDQEL